MLPEKLELNKKIENMLADSKILYRLIKIGMELGNYKNINKEYQKDYSNSKCKILNKHNSTAFHFSNYNNELIISIQLGLAIIENSNNEIIIETPIFVEEVQSYLWCTSYDIEEALKIEDVYEERREFKKCISFIPDNTKKRNQAGSKRSVSYICKPINYYKKHNVINKINFTELHDTVKFEYRSDKIEVLAEFHSTSFKTPIFIQKNAKFDYGDLSALEKSFIVKNKVNISYRNLQT